MTFLGERATLPGQRIFYLSLARFAAIERVSASFPKQTGQVAAATAPQIVDLVSALPAHKVIGAKPMDYCPS